MQQKIIAKISTCDFEDDTLELQLDKGFWEKHKIRCGEVEITTNDIIPIKDDFCT